MPEPGRGRRVLLIIGIAVAVLLVALTALSGFFVDVLWFREVGFSDVFWTILRAKVLLGLLFGLVFFALLYANLLIVRIITPRYRTLTPDQEIIERYRLAFEPYAWWLLPLIAAVIAAFVGFGVTTEWKTFLLWRNSGGVSFETSDPLFHRDVGFYVFSLPWLEFLQGWLFSSLVGITFITGVAHYVWGGIQPQAQGLGEKVSPQVKAHLSVLLGLIVLTKAWGYYLGRFDLLTSERGVVHGASFTDVNAQLPALKILVFIAIVCAILFLVNIRLRGWALPVIAVGLLALVSVMAGAAYPTFVQRFRVAPQEFQRERPYIVDNIRATRQAFGLDAVQEQNRTVAPAVTGGVVKDNAATVANIRVWRPDILLQDFQALQRIKQYYEFSDVDVDRYDLNGERRVVMLSAREIAQDGIPGGGGSWQNRHLVYTHGIGGVVSQVNTANAEGAPVFTLRDIPPAGEPMLTDDGARIYFGESPDVPFVVVDTGADELDYQGTPTNDQAQVTSHYGGTGGIPVGGLFQRALFAWRFRDVNLLLSGLIQGDSRIMINLGIQDRVPKAAPFLQYDGDPYAAVVGGRLKWIWDAYTTTSDYPYSEPVEDVGNIVSGGQQTPGPSGTLNYIRNSIKVVVDAYDGSLTYYAADPSDPILQVWENAFPGMFRPLEEASFDLLAHFRYPENLFQIQSDQFANYHVTDPATFYGKQDFWQVPDDPTVSTDTASARMRPYYVLMRLPNEQDETFVLITPFTPQGRQNLVGWMAANSDPGSGYGTLTSYEFPSGQNVDGPAQAFSRINSDPEFSSQRTLLSSAGSTTAFGDLLVIPLGNGLLYVEPFYVIADQPNAIPELKRVLVVNGGAVGIGTNLAGALADAVSGVEEPGGGGGGGGAGGGTLSEQVATLLIQAQHHFDLADEALRAQDLATYQSEIDAAHRAIAHANDLLAGAATGASPSPGATTSPSPGSPTASPSG
jgi:uncharacterized membrane protein (UPF0182 family)